MSVKINAFGNCQTTVKGTGIPLCDLESIGDYLGKGLLQKGVAFTITNGTVAISESVIDDLIKSRKLHQLINKIGSTQDTPDNEVFTDSIGLERSVREGKTKFTTMYDGSMHRLSSIHSLKGHNRWDVALYFSKGMLITVNTTGTSAKGFTAGRFDVSAIKFLNGTDVQQVSTIVQFTKPEEFNDRFLFIPWDKLGVDLSTKNGVIDCDITVVTPATNGSSTISVKVTAKSNSDTTILGLEAITGVFATGGVQTTTKPSPTVSYNVNTGLYDLLFATAFVTGDTYQPKLISGNTNVVSDGFGMFYTGQSELKTVS